MFDALSERLSGVFDRLTGRGALSEADVDAALREVRVALLEADVALPVVKDFIAKVRVDAIGEAVIRSVTPGQMIIKLVHDALVDMLGGDGMPETLRIDASSPPGARNACFSASSFGECRARRIYPKRGQCEDHQYECACHFYRG